MLQITLKTEGFDEVYKQEGRSGVINVFRSDPFLLEEGEWEVVETVAIEKINEVFDHWKAIFNKHKLRLIPSRKKKISARLRDGRTVEELKDAITSCSQNPYHIENGYLSIETICMNDRAVSGHLARLEKKQGKHSKYSQKPVTRRPKEKLSQAEIDEMRE